jgi:hypothetical protein
MPLIHNSALVPAAPKTIAVRAIVNTVLYTVPAGKTFSGFIAIGGNIQSFLNNVILLTAQQGASSAYLAGSQLKLDLIAGDVISCGSAFSDWSLVGTEK